MMGLRRMMMAVGGGSEGGNILVPPWGNVKSLLHFNGSNDSATFTDSVPGVGWSLDAGSALIKTSISKFGGASGYFAQQPTSIQCTNAAVGKFGSRDFTVACWIYPLSIPTAANSYWMIVTKDYAGGSQRGWQINLSGDVGGRVTATSFLNGSTGGAASLTSSAPPPINTWTHVAMCRRGNDLYLFVDGVLQGVAGLPAVGNIGDAAPPVQYGRIHNSGANKLFSYFGYVDEGIIVDGVGMYVDNFSPPVLQYPDG